VDFYKKPNQLPTINFYKKLDQLLANNIATNCNKSDFYKKLNQLLTIDLYKNLDQLLVVIAIAKVQQHIPTTKQIET